MDMLFPPLLLLLPLTAHPAPHATTPHLAHLLGAGHLLLGHSVHRAGHVLHHPITRLYGHLAAVFSFAFAVCQQTETPFLDEADLPSLAIPGQVVNIIQLDMFDLPILRQKEEVDCRIDLSVSILRPHLPI